MFDPRTLPNGDLYPNLGLLFVYAGLLADCITTRYGIWVKGLAEGNRLMSWLTDKSHVFRTWLDGGIIRPALTFLLYGILAKGGVFDNAHAWLVFLFGVPGWLMTILNLIKIRKAPGK